MIILLVLLIGAIAAAINTLPPSATNLGVLKYTADGTISKAMQFAYGAAVGEVVVASLALTFGVLIENLYENNLWIQIVFIILMILVGVYFLRKPAQEQINISSTQSVRFRNGLLLGTLNIPMFIYWTAILSMLSKYLQISDNSPWLVIILFLLGVFLGKLGVLYLYGRLSDYMTSNFSAFKGKLNKIIGIVLLLAATFQSIKLIVDMS
ncbi:hypothetical protein [Dokdonia sp. Hel_I_53]|uniref:hypothetical protein n=1 Tax=Dokdonia sp. Hel_I_53 TaxID=1566287 RepID=UPI00119BE93A|nr:hypothetical protein [Dokdonia sp. Hel_I_53]TVZ52945.1 hypothetical protein OD90_2133 [Dokdonia sp. Hel_I_53]